MDSYSSWSQNTTHKVIGPLELSWANGQLCHMIKAHFGTPYLILLLDCFRYLRVIFDRVSVKVNIDGRSQNLFYNLWAPKGMGIQTRLKLARKNFFLTRPNMPLWIQMGPNFCRNFNRPYQIVK